MMFNAIVPYKPNPYNDFLAISDEFRGLNNCIQRIWDYYILSKSYTPLDKQQYVLTQLAQKNQKIGTLLQKTEPLFIRIQNPIQLLLAKFKVQGMQQSWKKNRAVFLEEGFLPEDALRFTASSSFPKVYSDIVMNEILRDISALPLEDEFHKERTFKTLLKTQFKIIDVDGDGNCWLRAILQSLCPGLNEEDEEELQRELRTQLVTFMKENRSLWENYQEGCFIDPECPEGELIDASEYLEKLEEDGTFGDNLELSVIAEMLRTPIYVYKPTSVMAKKGGILVPFSLNKYGTRYKEESLPVYLYNSEMNVHYLKLEPIPHFKKEYSLIQKIAQLITIIFTTLLCILTKQ